MLLDMHQALRCHAKSKRSGLQCRAPAVRASAGCTAPVGGPPKGNQNALKHGFYTAEAIERRRTLRTLIRGFRGGLP